MFSPLVSDEYELTSNQASILSDAVTTVRETVGRVATDHRDLHSSVSKVGKAIDRVSLSPAQLFSFYLLNC